MSGAEVPIVPVNVVKDLEVIPTEPPSQDSLAKNPGPCDAQGSATGSQKQGYGQVQGEISGDESEGTEDEACHDEDVHISDEPEPGDAAALPLADAMRAQGSPGEDSDVRVSQASQESSEDFRQRLMETAYTTAILGRLPKVLEPSEDHIAEAIRESLRSTAVLPVEPSGGENEVGPSKEGDLATGAERAPYQATGAHPGAPHSACGQGSIRHHPSSSAADDQACRHFSRSAAAEALFQGSQRQPGVQAGQPGLNGEEGRQRHALDAMSQPYNMVSEVGSYADGLQKKDPRRKPHGTRSMVSGASSSRRSGGRPEQVSAKDKCGSYVSSLPGSAVGTPEMNAPEWSKERSNLELRAPGQKELSTRTQSGRQEAEERSVTPVNVTLPKAPLRKIFQGTKKTVSGGMDDEERSAEEIEMSIAKDPSAKKFSGDEKDCFRRRSNEEQRAPVLEGLSNMDLALEVELRRMAREGRLEEDAQSISWSDSRPDNDHASHVAGSSRDGSLEGAYKSKRKSSVGSFGSGRPSRPRTRRLSGMSASLVGSQAQSSVTGLSRSASQRTTASQQQQLIDKFYETVDGRLTDKDVQVRLVEEKAKMAQDQIAREKETAEERIAREAAIAQAQVTREKETAQERVAMAQDRIVREQNMAAEKERLAKDAADALVAQAKEAQTNPRQDRSRERHQAEAVIARERAVAESRGREVEAQRIAADKMLDAYCKQNEEARTLLREKVKMLEEAQQRMVERKNQELMEAEKEKQAALTRKEEELLVKMSLMQKRIDDYQADLDQRQLEQDRRVAERMSEDQVSQQQNEVLRAAYFKAQSKLEGFEKKLATEVDSNPATKQLYDDLSKEAREAQRKWQDHTKSKKQKGGQFVQRTQQHDEEKEALHLQLATQQSQMEELRATCLRLQRARERSQSRSLSGNRSSSEPAPSEKGRHRAGRGRGVRFEDGMSELSSDEEGQGALRTGANIFKPALKRTYAETGVKILDADKSTGKRLHPDVPPSFGGAEGFSGKADMKSKAGIAEHLNRARKLVGDTAGEMDALRQQIAQMKEQEQQYKECIARMQTELDEKSQRSLQAVKSSLESQQADVVTQLRKELVEELRQLRANQSTMDSRIEALQGQLTPQGTNSPSGRHSPNRLSLPPGRRIDNDLPSSDEESPPSEHSGGHLSLAKLSIATDSAPIVVNNHPRVNIGALKEYDGTGNFNSWLISFERQMKLYAQTQSDAEKIKYLPIRLSGIAMDYFNSLPQEEQLDYKKAVQALKDAFAEISRVEHTKWMRMIQRPNESVLQFATRMKRAQQEATEGDYDTKQMQDWVLKCFIEGLHRDLRLRLNDRDVKTWKEALDYAIYYERAYGRNGEESQHQSHPRPYARESRLHAISGDDEFYCPAYDEPRLNENLELKGELVALQREVATLKMDNSRKQKQNKQQKEANVSVMEGVGKPNDLNPYSPYYNPMQQNNPAVTSQPAQNLYVPPQSRMENLQGATAPVTAQGQQGTSWAPDKVWRQRVEAARSYVGTQKGKDRKYTGLSTDRWKDGFPVCNHCHVVGHIARECDKLPEEGREQERKQREAMKMKQSMTNISQMAPVEGEQIDEEDALILGYAKATGSRIFVDAKINRGFVTEAMVDPGGQVTIIDERYARECIDPEDIYQMPGKCTSASGHTLPVVGGALVDITVGKVTRKHPVFIVRGWIYRIVLGDNFLGTLNVDMCYRREGDTTKRLLYIEGEQVETSTEFADFMPCDETHVLFDAISISKEELPDFSKPFPPNPFQGVMFPISDVAMNQYRDPDSYVLPWERTKAENSKENP